VARDICGEDSHEARHLAESFGADAARYDRARPSYPDALVRRIVAASPGLDVLDVGIGTGIADLARQGGFVVEVALFEEWDPAGRLFDAVVAGQAWHWVDPVLGAGKAAEVLRPHGLLALYWHVFDPPAEVAEPFDEVLNRVAPDGPLKSPGLDLQQRNLNRAVDGIHGAGGFGEPELWRFEWQRRYTRDEWLDHLATTGQLTVLPPEQLATVLDTVGAAIDSIGGAFTMQYVTLATAANRG
jgi:SAM-dependent methyltransferase